MYGFWCEDFFFKFIVFLQRCSCFLKKILENRITSVQDLFILKNAVTLNRQKIVPSMHRSLKLMWNKKNISQNL